MQNLSNRLIASLQKNLSRLLLVSLIVGAVTVASYFISNRYYFDAVEQEQIKQSAQIEQLRASNNELEQIKANSAQLEQSLFEAERKHKRLNSLIPYEAELPVILNWVASQAKLRGLRLEHFAQGTRTNQQGNINEVTVTVEVLGNADGISRFAGDFARFERLLRVNSVRIVQEKEQDSAFGTAHAFIEFSAFVSAAPAKKENRLAAK